MSGRTVGTLVALLGLTFLLGACAGSLERGGTRAPGALPLGPPIWDPAAGVFIDPFSGYPVRGGGTR